jgi:hypothetical protein
MLTINVPVVYMARAVLIFDAGKSITGPLEGVAPENRGSPEMVRSQAEFFLGTWQAT